MSRLEVLQAIRLKGRMAPELLPSITSIPAADAPEEIAAAIADGHVVQPKADGPVRITPEGRDELRRLLAKERDGLDQAALGAAYGAFDPFNLALKNIVGAWQMRDETTPNDHADPGYDATVVARLRMLHDSCEGMLRSVVAAAPRLAGYPPRLSSALLRVEAGDGAHLARPTVDSYHQVWFELHEELMDCLGLTRHDEALAGRA